MPRLLVQIELAEDAEGKPYTVVSYYGGEKFGDAHKWCRKHGIDLVKRDSTGDHSLMFLTKEELQRLRC